MEFKAAVLFMPDGITRSKEKTPLMLQSVLFCPVLTWMVTELRKSGIGRFFVVSDVSAQDMMRPYFPADMDVTFVDGAKHGTELLKLLDGIEGRVVIVNGVVLPVGMFSGGAVYNAEASECRKVLAEHGAFAAFPKDCQIMQGFLPVGDEEELRASVPMCRQKIIEKHLAGGVQVLDSNSVYIDPRVEIGEGTVLLPGTILRGNTKIGKDCTIGPNAMIRDCVIGDETEVNASQLNESTVGKNTTVGPFAYVRPNSVIGDKVRVGDFVEIKNSVIGNGTKISHLTYVGDTDCGERINFGCGTVTTNYDGFKKYRCTIEDDSFIGCNTNLIAPVKVGKGSYIAAGSTVTEDVPEDALAVARARQVNKEEWAAKRREKNKK
ncbi:MAG: glucosamine-1-phosphate N-acetyltransferase [Oscillospiraceae bacterium]|nr:glucosamine-1-phosphate N-acetyltransferase [Oscillospiraceae bacterium]